MPAADLPLLDKPQLLERLAAGSAAGQSVGHSVGQPGSRSAGHPAGTTIVITPNARLTASLSREFDSYQAARGLPAWETADVLPFGAWVERLHEDALYSRAAPGLPLLLSAAEEQHLWQAVIESSEWSGLLLSGAQAAAQCRASWQLAHAWNISGAILSASAAENAWLADQQNEDARAFASWARAYVARTAREGCTDRARLPDGVARLLDGHGLRLPAGIVAYAFDILTPQQQSFLAACAGAGMTVERASPLRADGADGSQGRAVRLAFPSAREELAQAARWARARLEARAIDGDAEAAPRIAVVVPDLEARRREVTRVFARALDPAWGLPAVIGAAPRPVPPFNVSLGAPLTDYPVFDAALALLEWAGGGLDHARVSRLLRSPFIAGAEAEFGARARLDALLRQRVPPRLRLGALLAAASRATDPAQGGTAPPCPRLLAALARVRELARESLAAARSPQEWARRYSELLAAAGFPGERASDSAEFQTLAKWQETLGELARLERVAPRLTHAQALSRLRRLAADTLFQPRASVEGMTAPIQVLGILESVGLMFDHLWVSGLTEDAWPLAARPDPFLPIALQKKAGIPQSSADSALMLDARITAEWQAAAGEVVFSHPLAEADRALLPSPLIARVPVRDVACEEALGSPAATDSFRARIFEAGQGALEAFDGEAAPPYTLAEVGGGTAVLANQAACPFRAYARHRLAAEPLEAPVAGLDAAARGQLLHALFARIWGDLGSQAALVAATPERLAAIIDTAAEAALARLRAARPDLIGERYAAIERQRLAGLAHEWLAVERGRPDFEVIAREDRRTLQAGGLRLTGRIDRMDRLADGSHALIDYKSGRASPAGWLGERPGDPQLPLYAVNAGEGLGAVAFARIRKGDMRFDGLARTADALPGAATVEAHRTAKRFAADWDALLAGWRAELDALGAGFVAGDARVAPKHLFKTCEGCGLDPLCRVHERFGALDEAGADADGAGNDD